MHLRLSLWLGLSLSWFQLSACTGPALINPLPAPLQPASVLEQLSIVSSRDILLKLKNPADLARISRLAGASRTALISPQAQVYKLTLPAGRSLLGSLEVLSGQVAYAEPNSAFSLPDFQIQQTAFDPDDPDFDMQWNLKSSRIDQAWTLSRGNRKLTVAVIDSGVDPDHPEFAGRLEPLEDVFREDNGEDIYREPSGGQLDFRGRDGNGHGTHITGIIAATLDNGRGVSGIADVRIVPIKATDYTGGTHAATLVSAFQRAIDRGADIINISIGGPPSKGTRALADVVQLALQRGIPIIAATGNESARSRGQFTAVTLPAAYEGVIAVGAHTEFDRAANYSNGGAEIDLLAPGGGGLNQGEGRKVWSTWPTYPTYANFQGRVSGLSYAATAGTSMATPHVTGVVALMLAREPQLTPAQIRSRLIATADDLGPPHFDRDSGYGKLNAYRALKWNADDAHD